MGIGIGYFWQITIRRVNHYAASPVRIDNDHVAMPVLKLIHSILVILSYQLKNSTQTCINKYPCVVNWPQHSVEELSYLLLAFV